MARIFDASVYQPVLTGAEDDADADANPDADATTATTNDRHGYKPRLAAVKERVRVTVTRAGLDWTGLDWT